MDSGRHPFASAASTRASTRPGRTTTAQQLAAGEQPRALREQPSASSFMTDDQQKYLNDSSPSFQPLGISNTANERQGLAGAGAATGYTMSEKYHLNGGAGAPVATKSNGKRWKIVAGVLVALLVIVGAVLGGVLGSRAGKNTSATAAADGASGSSSSSSAARGSSSGTGTSSSAEAAPTGPPEANITISPLRAWSWGEDKAIGMALGGWLLLERWMNEDWMVAQAGESAVDEWTFCANMGAENATRALQEHWNSWITEEDVGIMHAHGINMLRIPTGFWQWIPTVEGEPYVNGGQTQQIERIFSYAHKYGMHAVIDLHGLPGSQNGEQTSGHLTTSPSWFGNTANIQRSHDTVAAVMEWIATTPYRSMVVGIEVINEPRPYTDAQVQQVSDYYAQSYTAIQAAPYPVPMFIADAYQTEGVSYWRDFAAARATTPASLVMVDHPYPGNFPVQFSQSDILGQVCSAAARYQGFPIPIVISEWSLYTGVKDTSFEQQFYEQQLATWAWSGGGMFWSYRLKPSQRQLAAGLDYSQYSFITLVQNGTDVVPSLSSQSLSADTTTAEGTNAYISSLQNGCGSAPANAAPYSSQGATVSSWAGVTAAQGLATATLRATGTAGTRHRRRSGARMAV